MRHRFNPSFVIRLFSLGVAAVLLLTITGPGMSSAETPSTTSGWGEMPDLPYAVERPAVTTMDGKVHIIGGVIGDNDLLTDQHLIFDPVSQKYSTVMIRYPKAVENAAAVVAADRLYVIGGWVKDEGAIADVNYYRPEYVQWVNADPLLKPVSGAGVAAIGTNIYVIGGWNANDSWVPDLQVYDLLTKTWSSKASMTTRRSELGVAVVNGLIYAIGGNTPTGTTAVVEVYDPAQNKWKQAEPLPEPRTDFATAVQDGKIYVLGGSQVWAGVPEASALVYDPASDTWSLASSLPMPTPRRSCEAAAVFPYIYILGGHDGVARSKANEVFGYRLLFLPYTMK